MPFKPRLVHPEDHSTEQEPALSEQALSKLEIEELPADLQMLAEQLLDDAQHLAARYPATSGGSAAPGGVTKGRGVLATSTAPAARSTVPWSRVAAAAVVVAATFWGSSKLAHRQPAPNAIRPVALHVVTDSRPAPADAQTQPTSFPAMFFQDLSGPEQEGLLDLLDDQVLEQTSLSI